MIVLIILHAIWNQIEFFLVPNKTGHLSARSYSIQFERMEKIHFSEFNNLSFAQTGNGTKIEF